MLALLALLPDAAAAQPLPPPVVEAAAGTLFFPDDALAKEGFVGAAVRLYVQPRVSIGPEVAYVRGTRHDHFMLTGNVTFDLLRPPGGRPRAVAPFIVAGAGLFRTNEEFPGGTFSSGDPSFTAGGGVRARVGDRVFVGVEARLGWELHVRVNGIVGVQLGAD